MNNAQQELIRRLPRSKDAEELAVIFRQVEADFRAAMPGLQRAFQQFGTAATALARDPVFIAFVGGGSGRSRCGELPPDYYLGYLVWRKEQGFGECVTRVPFGPEVHF